MQCVHQYRAGARPLGESFNAVQHTDHMSCGQIGDPQQRRFLPRLVIDNLHIESEPMANPYRLAVV